MSDSGVVKAYFLTEMGNKFQVQFNPTDVQLDATADWQNQERQNSDVLIEFKNVKPRTLSMTLIFDTTTNNQDVSKVYVSHLLNVFRLHTLEDIDPESGAVDPAVPAKKRNQYITFNWGDFSFEGALTSLKTKYTMFSKSGLPVRAEVGVSLTELKKMNAQAVGGSRVDITVPQVKLVQLQAGQTLSSLASMAGMAVGTLAAMNGISDPMNVPAGAPVMLPPGRN
jgi:LysM repeat protein